jgi:RimJ/RimL family protein N-acetyltransferase
MKLIEIETERLYLRQWRPEDRAPFAALNADPKVTKFLPSTPDRAASDAMADRLQSLIAERGWGLWAVETKQGGSFIGFVGLHVPAPGLPFSPCVEVGWRLAAAYWGRGYATEAARESLRVGFERLELPEIVAFDPAANTRSRALMERLGMRPDGIFEHPRMPEGSALRPHYLYRMSREQWIERSLAATRSTQEKA